MANALPENVSVRARPGRASSNLSRETGRETGACAGGLTRGGALPGARRRELACLPCAPCNRERDLSVGGRDRDSRGWRGGQHRCRTALLSPKSSPLDVARGLPGTAATLGASLLRCRPRCLASLISRSSQRSSADGLPSSPPLTATESIFAVLFAALVLGARADAINRRVLVAGMLVVGGRVIVGLAA